MLTKEQGHIILYVIVVYSFLHRGLTPAEATQEAELFFEIKDTSCEDDENSLKGMEFSLRCGNVTHFVEKDCKR